MDDEKLPQNKKLKVSFESSDLTIELWKSKNFTDVVFVVEGEEFPAHKMVLATESEYFRQLLYGGMREASQKKITISGITPEIFKIVLEYVYTRSAIEKPLDIILETMRAADYLRFEHLKTTLGKHVAGIITNENVLYIHIYNEKYNLQLPRVEKRLLKYTEDETIACKILKSPTFQELPKEHLIALISRDTFVAPEYEILQAVIRWKEHNEVENNISDSEVAECIRLSRFTTKQIFDLVKPTGLFSEEKISDGVRVLTRPILSETKPRGKSLPDQQLLKQAVNLSFHGNQSRKAVYKEEPHLVNLIHLVPGSDEKLKWYSYTLSVEYNYQLFDYRCFRCRGTQVLYFPTVPIRQVNITIPSYEMESEHSRTIYRPSFRVPGFEKFVTINPFTITVSRLELSSEPIPFRFLANGVIAPLCDYKVNITSHFDEGQKAAVAYFNQPYSASTLTIRIKIGTPSGDISIGLGEREDQVKITKNQTVDTRSEFVVNVEEMVIGYVTIKLFSTMALRKPVENWTIVSISCKSSATHDDVDMEQFTPFLTGYDC